MFFVVQDQVAQLYVLPLTVTVVVAIATELVAVVTELVTADDTSVLQICGVRLWSTRSCTIDIHEVTLAVCTM